MPGMWDRIAGMRARFDEIEAEMATPERARDAKRLQELAVERSQLEPLVLLLGTHLKSTDELSQAQELRQEADDDELKQMALAEVEQLTAQLVELDERAKRALLPTDPNDERSVIIEIRAGTGGDEAGLWAGDLYRAYGRYADSQRWKTEIISASTTPTGGF